MSVKRHVQVEEWGRLRLGSIDGLTSFSQLASVLAAWKTRTNTDPSPYFDILPDALVPKFWTGTLDTPDFVLEVVPMGTSVLDATRRRQLGANISGMLSSTGASLSIKAGEAPLSTGGDRFDALMEAFCSELYLARRRLVLRRYAVARASLPFLRGRITFPAQFVEDIGRPGRFAAEWIGLTENVPENRIFKEVLLRMKPRCSTLLKGKIDFCLSEFGEVERTGDLNSEWTKVRSDRLPPQYLSLLSQSRQLLNLDSSGIFVGHTFATAEIIFTSRLFEKYVGREISKMAPDLGLTANTQKRGQFLCLREDGGNSFELIPDITLTNGQGKVTFIVDTKWKWLDHSLKAFGIANSDVYQMLAYAAKFQCQNVILLYPDTSTATGNIGFISKFILSIGSEDYKIHIAKLPLLGNSLSISREYLRELLGKTA